MLIRRLPLLAGVVPVIAIFTAYWLGVRSGQLPSCMPLFDGCVSISATGRRPPGSFLFRAVQLPFAGILLVIWYFCEQWLLELDNESSRVRIKIMFASGMMSALALVIYVTFLGSNEPIYEFMRRFGIYGYFLGVALAQLMTTITFYAHARSVRSVALTQLARLMLLVVALPFVLGILNLVLKSVLVDTGSIENRIEWIVTLLAQSWYVLLYFAWRRTGFDVVVRAH